MFSWEGTAYQRAKSSEFTSPLPTQLPFKCENNYFHHFEQEAAPSWSRLSEHP